MGRLCATKQFNGDGLDERVSEGSQFMNLGLLFRTDDGEFGTSHDGFLRRIDTGQSHDGFLLRIDTGQSHDGFVC